MNKEEIHFIRVQKSANPYIVRLINEAGNPHTPATVSFPLKNTRIVIYFAIRDHFQETEKCETTLAKSPGQIRKELEQVEKFYHRNFKLRYEDKSIGAGMLVMSGRLGQIEKATRLRLLQVSYHNGNSFVGHKENYSIPQPLWGVVYMLGGLDIISPKTSSLQESTMGGGNEEPKQIAFTSKEFSEYYNFPTDYQGKELKGQGKKLCFLQFGGNWFGEPSLKRSSGCNLHIMEF